MNPVKVTSLVILSALRAKDLCNSSVALRVLCG